MEPAVEEMLAGRAGAAEEKSAAKTIVFQGKPDAGQRLISRYTGCESLLSSQTQETMALVTAEHPWAVVVAAESPAEADQVAALLDATPGHAAPVISYAVDGSATLAEHETVRWLAKPVRRRSLLASLAQVAPQACTILIVDDNPADVQLLSRMLRTAQKEYIVREAFGGGSAIQEMSAQPPDLVLLDLIMPDMNGLQVVEWMQGDPRLAAIPVLMVTAGDVAAQRGPFRAPKVQAVAVTKSGGLLCQGADRCRRAALHQPARQAWIASSRCTRLTGLARKTAAPKE
jgi:CheY-like chemotaxis protein